MSMSRLLVRIGASLVETCIVVAMFSGAGSAPSADGGDTGSTPPPTTTTTPPATTDGNPWHG